MLLIFLPWYNTKKDHGSIRRRPALQMPKCNEIFSQPAQILGAVHICASGTPARYRREGPNFCARQKKRADSHYVFSVSDRGRRLQSQRLFHKLWHKMLFFLRNHLAGFSAEYEEQTPAGSQRFPFLTLHLRSDRGFEIQGYHPAVHASTI
jgi:hypothetical protein